MITCQYEEDFWLLQGVASSDDTAIKEIYRTILPPITQYLQGKGASSNTAEDLFQEAIVVLFKRLRQGDFSLTCRLRSYLQSIVRNLWLKQTRDYKTSVAFFPENDIVDLDDNTQLYLENQERESIFWGYFQNLPEGCQQILQLFFQGSSMKKIAQKLDTTEGYIKKRKHHCKQKLVDTIQADNRYNELKWDE